MALRAVASGLAFGVATGGGALAQEPPFTKAESAIVSALEAIDDRMVVLDAFLICPILLAREPRSMRASLEADEWTLSMFFEDAVDPFFADYEGTKTYDGERTGTVYVGREEYPDTAISYCSYSLEGATGDLSLDPLSELFDSARVESVSAEDGARQFATWRADLDQSFLGRAELTETSLYIQYTLIERDS